jgi:peptidoglycan/xylan/chitin deacetylase (PgdA/CDA1 family)
MARHVPILTYHAVTEAARPTPLAVAPRTFAEQMRALAEAGYRAVPLCRLADGHWAELPERAVVITFDDGYRSVLEEAAPILRNYGFTATLFLVAGLVDGKAGQGDGWQPPWPLLGWAEVEALARDGFELGAHTLSHPVLPHLPLAEAEREMVESQRQIGERTGQEVRVLAYPYGARSAGVEGLARQHFEAACGTRLSLAGPRSNPFDLERVDAYYLTPAGLAGKLETARARAYLMVRRVLRRARRLVRQDWDAPRPGKGLVGGGH